MKTKKKTVVLIDDHEVVRAGLSTIISAENDLTVVAQKSDAISGLDCIKSHLPDIAVLDINMPGAGSFDMASKAMSIHPDLKVIFLTAHDTDANLEMAIKSGASGFITKSESLTSIVEGIRQSLSASIPYFSADIRKRLLQNQVIDEKGNILKTDVLQKHQILSQREKEILFHVASGKSAKQIASTLHISSKTVERHKSNIMAKLQLRTQVELTKYAIKEGIIAV
ncbi:MAG: response regulator transcription factor [Proteobacteria bacterium]|nr:response regulator transcription factor [Pseudomonadota bacterium]